MKIQLNDVEARILGSLMEKSLATPEYYPLSLNGLINACNQKSSREPVVDYDEATVQTGLESLCEKDIVFKSKLSRVPKYEEHFSQNRQLVPKEIAVLCVLLLRGPQTVGELRGRTSRMYTFETLEDVLATIDNLSEYGLADQLPRLPGRKEPRYGQLLCEASEDIAPTAAHPPEQVVQGDDMVARIEKMEQAIEGLQGELSEIRQAFAEFKEQFE